MGWERGLCVLTFTSVPVQLEGGWKTEETKDNQSNIFVSFLQDEGVKHWSEAVMRVTQPTFQVDWMCWLAERRIQICKNTAAIILQKGP